MVYEDLNFSLNTTDYMHIYEFEKISVNYWRKLIYDNYLMVVIAGALYVKMTFLGPYLMKSRRPYNIKNALISWNALLSLFSLFFAIRYGQDLFYHVKIYGLFITLCVRTDYSMSTDFWILAFLFSKFGEFGDTLFLILRKRKIIFLHWYHHITVFLMSYYVYPNYEPYLSLFFFVNSIVHFFMYSYYAVMAYGFKVRRRIAMMITILQLLQFVYLISVAFYLLFFKLNGGICETTSYTSLNILLFIIVTYFILFAKFFIEAYVNRQKTKPKSS